MNELEMKRMELQKQLEELDNMKVQEEIVDAEIVGEAQPEVQPETEQPKEEFVTLVKLGYKKDGSLLFSVEGDPNLIAIDGLIKYAEREMAAVWTKNRQIKEGEIQPNENN